MNDTIYRKDAIQAVWKPQVKPNELIFDALKTAIESEINKVPSADRPQGDYNRGYCDAVQGIADEMVKQGKYIVQDRPQGKWIEDYNGNGWNDYWDYTCSNCGKRYERADAVLCKANFCPNCGARMKGADDE